jgi:hypothetical protein
MYSNGLLLTNCISFAPAMSAHGGQKIAGSTEAADWRIAAAKRQ